MKTFEDDKVKLDEEEGRWLDLVFKTCEESLRGLKSGGGSSLEWLTHLGEECAGRWWWSTLESCLEEDGLIACSNDDLDRLPNVILVD